MIKENVEKILRELPSGVMLVAAAKAKSVGEIKEAVDAGVKIIGQNYIQEAEKAFNEIGNKVKWHFIGHLQSNKLKKAVKIFDMIETLDSVSMADALDAQCSAQNKIMPVLIEINSACEEQKSGVLPQDTAGLIKEISSFKHIRIKGLMTMGPLAKTPEDIRPYFKETKKLFDEIRKNNLPNVDMEYLSMGMSDSYKIAIQEGANLVRIGSAIFGDRK